MDVVYYSTLNCSSKRKGRKRRRRRRKCVKLAREKFWYEREDERMEVREGEVEKEKDMG